MCGAATGSSHRPMWHESNPRLDLLKVLCNRHATPVRRIEARDTFETIRARSIRVGGHPGRGENVHCLTGKIRLFELTYFRANARFPPAGGAESVSPAVDDFVDISLLRFCLVSHLWS